MKKKLLKSFAIITACSTAAFAQPTLTATGINPVVGDAYTTKMCNYVSPGSAGANQTWDLSSMTVAGTINYTSANPSSTPMAANFTN